MVHTSHFDFRMLKDMVKNIWNTYGYSKHPLDVLQKLWKFQDLIVTTNQCWKSWVPVIHDALKYDIESVNWGLRKVLNVVATYFTIL